jgi:hypothetical protein
LGLKYFPPIIPPNPLDQEENGWEREREVGKRKDRVEAEDEERKGREGTKAGREAAHPTSETLLGLLIHLKNRFLSFGLNFARQTDAMLIVHCYVLESNITDVIIWLL